MLGFSDGQSSFLYPVANDIQGSPDVTRDVAGAIGAIAAAGLSDRAHGGTCQLPSRRSRLNATLDSLLAAAESRRAAALREIERRRDRVASHLRRASDDVIDGEFAEDSSASAPDAR
jgi:hypothetical protein